MIMDLWFNDLMGLRDIFQNPNFWDSRPTEKNSFQNKKSFFTETKLSNYSN